MKSFRVDQLRRSPKNKAIHPDFDPDNNILDEKLLANVKEKGIIDLIFVKPDGTIEDGYRRWECAKRLGMERISGYLLNHGEHLFEHFQLRRQKTAYESLVAAPSLMEGITLRGKESEQRVKRLEHSLIKGTGTILKAIRLIKAINRIAARDPDTAKNAHQLAIGGDVDGALNLIAESASTTFAEGKYEITGNILRYDGKNYKLQPADAAFLKRLLRSPNRTATLADLFPSSADRTKKTNLCRARRTNLHKAFGTCIPWSISRKGDIVTLTARSN